MELFIRGREGDLDLDLDQERWKSFLSLMPHLVAICTACWGLLHLLLSRNIKAESFGITKGKDKVCVHNNMISTTHAVFSFVCGIIYFAKGWAQEVAHKEFAFSEYFHVVTAVSVGYILYDVVFLAIYFEYMKNQLTTILVHHAIFVFTYFLSQYVPCTLGIVLYFWFSLTEISTPFLNYNWFLMKANFSKELWKKNGYVLLLTFGIRWIITVASLPFLWWYHTNHVANGKIYSQVNSKFHWLVDGYLFFFALGVGGLLLLNSYWYYVLLKKAYDAITNKSSDKEE